MFIGTKQEKIALMRIVIPAYLSNDSWLDNVKQQYDAKDFNNIREVLVEAIDLDYIKNLQATRTIKDGISFHRGQKDNQPQLTKKGEKFLKDR